MKTVPVWMNEQFLLQEMLSSDIIPRAFDSLYR